MIQNLVWFSIRSTVASTVTPESIWSLKSHKNIWMSWQHRTKCKKLCSIYFKYITHKKKTVPIKTLTFFLQQK